MTATIQVEIKTIYGTDKIYPVCSKAEVFCKMLNQKTLTERDIELIKKLDIAVQVASSRPTML